MSHIRPITGAPLGGCISNLATGMICSPEREGVHTAHGRYPRSGNEDSRAHVRALRSQLDLQVRDRTDHVCRVFAKKEVMVEGTDFDKPATLFSAFGEKGELMSVYGCGQRKILACTGSDGLSMWHRHGILSYE